MTTNFNSESIYVSFHIGRGGHFHNQGHVSFIGEMDFDDLVRANINDGKLFVNDSVYNPETDEETELPRDKWTYTDGAGNTILEEGEADQKTGCIDFDGQYDTDYTRRLSDCGDKEWNAIIKAFEDGEYMGDELKAAVIARLSEVDDDTTYIYEHDEDDSPKGSFFDIYENHGLIFMVCDGRFSGTYVTTYLFPEGTTADDIREKLDEGGFLWNLDFDTLKIINHYERN